MIDFHYSDTWADPGKQGVPAAWKNYDFDQMKQAVADHTKVFQSANINEEQREGMSAEESAALDDEEVKRIAHLPDEE